MTSGKRVERATLTAQIEDAIRLDIIDGSLEPGQRLAAAELSGRYGVSATPLREALQRLAADNLVLIDPRLGATVAPISRTHLHDTYRVREMLETLALEDSIDNADEAWELRLRDLFGEFQVAVALAQKSDTNGVLSWSRAHRAFHDGLLAAGSSHWLKDLLNILNDHSERYRMLSAQTGVRDPIGEHASIFAAALARDKEGAVAALRSHLRRTVDVIEHSVYIDETPTELSSDGPEAA